MRMELRAKVELREKQLEEALAVSEKDGTQTARIESLTNQLKVSADAVGGGWEHMTDVSAERLSAWLESTRSLIPGEKPVGAHVVSPSQPMPEEVAEVSAGHGKVN